LQAKTNPIPKHNNPNHNHNPCQILGCGSGEILGKARKKEKVNTNISMPENDDLTASALKAIGGRND